MRIPKIHQIPAQGDKWQERAELCASDFGQGSNKKLFVHVRFDGNGNAIVKFIVENHGKATDFEKYDSAVTYYNTLY